MMAAIEAIKVLRGCGASGKSLAAGTVYAVPGEVSDEDARILVRMGKAEACARPPPPDTGRARRKMEVVE